MHLVLVGNLWMLDVFGALLFAYYVNGKKNEMNLESSEKMSS